MFNAKLLFSLVNINYTLNIHISLRIVRKSL